jgi:hypothetical protein
MSKLKIEKGASRVRRVPLKTTIDGAVADDIELMCQWSENETSYVVNQLLRFALEQSEDFQEYKQSHGGHLPTTEDRKNFVPASAALKPESGSAKARETAQ